MKVVLLLVLAFAIGAQATSLASDNFENEFKTQETVVSETSIGRINTIYIFHSS